MRRTRFLVGGVMLALFALGSAASAQDPPQVMIESRLIVTYGVGAGWAFPFGSEFEALESGPTFSGQVGIRPSTGTVGGELQVGYTRLGIEDVDDAHFRLITVNAVLTKTMRQTVLYGGVSYGNGKSIFDDGDGDSENGFGLVLGVRQRLGKGRVPVLGELPVVGQLFKSQSSGDDERNLLILVKPRIVLQGDNEQ